MRTVFCFVCLFTLITSFCFAGEFVPPEEKEPPILNNGIASDDLIPLGITSIAIAAAGITVTGIGFFNIYNNIENGFESPVLQAGIIMTAGGAVLTAVAAIVFDFIFNEKESLTISQE